MLAKPHLPFSMHRHIEPILCNCALYRITITDEYVHNTCTERIRELQILVNNLNIRTHLLADTVSNFVPVTAYLPYDREKVTNELQFVIDHTEESKMQEFPALLQNIS